MKRNLGFRAVILGTIGIATTQSLRLTRCTSSTTSSTRKISLSAGPVADLRKEYSEQPLLEDDLKDRNPYQQFQIWFDEACNSNNFMEPNAMVLSTCKDNRPSGRVVLLKGFDDRGFVWYTNYNSRKGDELEANKHAALTFWWMNLERSVRIEGEVEKVSEKESEEYFHSRPRGSQIGAWSSNQSTEIADREALDQQANVNSKRFEKEGLIPKPPHWGGYRLVPTRIEFWKGRASRLHDRIVYELDPEAGPVLPAKDLPIGKGIMTTGKWTMKRLQP
jgi:pyridoxamine 5'-phosphate oxidase